MKWIPIDKKRITKNRCRLIMIGGKFKEDGCAFFPSVVNYHSTVDKFESYDTNGYIDETEIEYTHMAEFADGSIVIPEPPK